jgi:hypothetical protein
MASNFDAICRRGYICVAYRPASDASLGMEKAEKAVSFVGHPRRKHAEVMQLINRNRSDEHL